MSVSYPLVQCLADGEFHSGEVLGENLGVTRAAIWKQVQALKVSGLDVFSVPGKGYCLSQPLELLEKSLICERLSQIAPPFDGVIDILNVVDSTSNYLRRICAHKSTECFHVCFAEYQTSGRGRRGRIWVSPYGSNLCFSLHHKMNRSPDSLGGLSLAVGVAILRVLQSAKIPDLGLKWPNDIYHKGEKLAGALIELTGEMDGSTEMIIGIGLNLCMSDSAADSIDQPWTDLSACRERPGRNRLASDLIESIVSVLTCYEQDGLAPFVQEWEENDIYSGLSVCLQLHDQSVTGIACGIDQYGAIKLNIDGKLNHYHVGDISLRAVQ
ncbi:MAG: bifunctional biotin--[acetyl-CoA-carboxylase] ligase/biotin operon repressor BirA [Gammaproteobacteria bacterium]